MIKEVRILESNCTPDFQKSINSYLKNGWRIKGNMVSVEEKLAVMLIKK